MSVGVRGSRLGGDESRVDGWELVADGGDLGRVAIALQRNRDGLEFAIDLADIVARGAGQWRLALFDGEVAVPWETAHWTVPSMAPLTVGDRTVALAVLPDATGTVVIATDGPLPAPRLENGAVRTSRTGLRIATDVLVASHQATHMELQLVNRVSRDVIAIPALSSRVQGVDGPRTRYRVKARIRWAELPELGPDVFLDVFVNAGAHDGEGKDAAVATTPARVMAPKGWRQRLARMRTGRAFRDTTASFFDPRYTFKARALTVYVAQLETPSMRELERLARFTGLRRWWYARSHPPLWLVGELPYKAQDTGLAFFAHVRAHHPEIDARYVVAADSPDYERVAALGPVVKFGSPEHVRAALLASRVVSSHHPDYLYPMRTPWMRKKVGAVLVFLQHGVMGTKWMANLYGKRKGGFSTDLILVSSPREKAMIVRDFGYQRDEVAVTGLTRFDTLLDGTQPEPQVLVIPTWRDWIHGRDDFLESEFISAWSAFLSDARFAQAVAGHSVVMILHPNFREFASDFALPGVRMLRQGEEAVQYLLKQSALLVTDYSSVGFDFALQHRPVVYYQFDRQRFLGPKGSHLDLDVDLPGEVALTHDGALEAIERVANRGFQPTPEQRETADSYFPMEDRGSSERAFQAVLRATRSRPSELRRRLRVAARATGTIVRKSRVYFPLMRALMRATRLAPVNPNLVVFESGLGRRYGDSPKAIYREVCRTRPTMTKVWVSAVPIPDADPRTVVVPRLSWKYFWYLGRAKYWVNNQSFPHYVRRRAGQEFVQTWHGTPLKRMLFDLDHVTGRDDGYTARAAAGAAQWSVLTSPNPHTTQAMASAFRHRARVLEVGYPRNDVFYGDDAAQITQRIRRRLGIGDGRMMVLFAPTFRDTALEGGTRIVPTEGIDLDRFAAAFGDRATLVLRRHVLDRNPASIPDAARHCVIDATEVPDVQELLVAADVLITDYSSLYVDFLNTRRPCLFFAPDLVEYRDQLRGFYLDYGTDLPGPVTQTVEELFPFLAGAIDSGSIPGYDLDAFAERFCGHDDGHAAARVVADVFGRAAKSEGS